MTRKRQVIKIQLAGIDCPEKKQPFGNKARKFTSRFALGQMVTVKQKDKSKQGVIVANVILFNGGSLNQQLIRSGLAWWYRQRAPDDRELAKLEAGAKKDKQGFRGDFQINYLNV